MCTLDWTAFGTFLLFGATLLLVWVTKGLWTEAQNQLKEQKRATSLLNKPFLRIEDLDAKWFDTVTGNNYGIVFRLYNAGGGAAWNVHVLSTATVIGATPMMQADGDYYEAFIGRGERFIVQVPGRSLAGVLDHYYLSLRLTITFDDVDKPGNKIEYKADRVPDGQWSILPMFYKI
ncbi:MAG: hypothetical protein Q8922_02890 [Bacteroidota bacterium]|nr:hypothetical protein [Bacteroidota bacterium]MDP4232912.1 hypothetical protein [Bacteroidota bacterium]MDP4241956.1 hypothetical protein [Bacteroidota bacterium]MDP4286859.1 hypothetical protein [Bacteroidota bacterium]